MLLHTACSMASGFVANDKKQTSNLPIQYGCDWVPWPGLRATWRSTTLTQRLTSIYTYTYSCCRWSELRCNPLILWCVSINKYTIYIVACFAANVGRRVSDPSAKRDVDRKEICIYAMRRRAVYLFWSSEVSYLFGRFAIIDLCAAICAVF